ncbi:hypothetical protein LCGC14_1281080 [marine sediment metagenome]|uniref:Uncharacterized protein n=1 Tax=marine sediment metagenome TaxID=412755 RepID=A0A0F9NY81_9ZZZZ
MAEKDFRVRVDLTFDPADEGVARGLYNHAVNQMSKAVNIDGTRVPREVGKVTLSRCGHRIGESCEEIDREEVA